MVHALLADHAHLRSRGGLFVMASSDREQPSFSDQAEVVAFALKDPRIAILGRTLFMEYLPVPAWVKMVQPGPRFVMLRINPAYEVATGIPASEYAGHLDAEVWDGPSTSSFEATDREVLEKRTACRGIDVATMQDGSVVRWCNWKWPMFERPDDRDDRIVAICGFGERENA